MRAVKCLTPGGIKESDGTSNWKKAWANGFSPGTLIWRPDDSQPRCVRCGVNFSFFVRRHHCRYCGHIVCAACSKGRRANPRDTLLHTPARIAQAEGAYDSLVRMCDGCVTMLDNREKYQKVLWNTKMETPTPTPTPVSGGSAERGEEGDASEGTGEGETRFRLDSQFADEVRHTESRHAAGEKTAEELMIERLSPDSQNNSKNPRSSTRSGLTPERLVFLLSKEDNPKCDNPHAISKTLYNAITDSKMDVNFACEDGTTALLAASRNVRGSPAVVELLLSHGANVHAQDEHGQTAAHAAATLGREAVLRKLLAWGAHVHTENSRGAIPGQDDDEPDELCVGMPPEVQNMLVEHGSLLEQIVSTHPGKVVHAPSIVDNADDAESVKGGQQSPPAPASPAPAAQSPRPQQAEVAEAKATSPAATAAAADPYRAWTCYYDEVDGAVFYHNEFTNESRWDEPASFVDHGSPVFITTPIEMLAPEDREAVVASSAAYLNSPSSAARRSPSQDGEDEHFDEEERPPLLANPEVEASHMNPEASPAKEHDTSPSPMDGELDRLSSSDAHGLSQTGEIDHSGDGASSADSEDDFSDVDAAEVAFEFESPPEFVAPAAPIVQPPPLAPTPPITAAPTPTAAAAAAPPTVSAAAPAASQSPTSSPTASHPAAAAPQIVSTTQIPPATPILPTTAPASAVSTTTDQTSPQPPPPPAAAAAFISSSAAPPASTADVHAVSIRGDSPAAAPVAEPVLANSTGPLVTPSPSPAQQAQAQAQGAFLQKPQFATGQALLDAIHGAGAGGKSSPKVATGRASTPRSKKARRKPPKAERPESGAPATVPEPEPVVASNEAAETEALRASPNSEFASSTPLDAEPESLPAESPENVNEPLADLSTSENVNALTREESPADLSASEKADPRELTPEVSRSHITDSPVDSPAKSPTSTLEESESPKDDQSEPIQTETPSPQAATEASTQASDAESVLKPPPFPESESPEAAKRNPESSAEDHDRMSPSDRSSRSSGDEAPSALLPIKVDASAGVLQQPSHASDDMEMHIPSRFYRFFARDNTPESKVEAKAKTESSVLQPLTPFIPPSGNSLLRSRQSLSRTGRVSSFGDPNESIVYVSSNSVSSQGDENGKLKTVSDFGNGNENASPNTQRGAAESPKRVGLLPPRPLGQRSSLRAVKNVGPLPPRPTSPQAEWLRRRAPSMEF